MTRWVHKTFLFFAVWITAAGAKTKNFDESAMVEKLLSRGARNTLWNCLDVGLEQLLIDGGHNTTHGGEQDELHYCRIRDHEPYPQHLWNFAAGWQCIFWAQQHRFASSGFSIHNCGYVGSNGQNTTLFFFVIGNRIVFPNHRIKEDLPLIRKIFRTDFYMSRFIECCRDAEYCCFDTMNSVNVALSEENPCPATWDGWSCFPPAKPGTTATLRCPAHSYSSEAPCIAFSERECLKTGGWNQQTNYQPCLAAPMFRRRLTFHIYALIVSIALSAPAVVMFFMLRKSTLRNILHRNLLLAIIVKNILSIVSNWVVMWESVAANRSATQISILVASPEMCKFLAYLESVALNMIFTWMLMEAFYLHKTIVRVFSQDPKLVAIYIFVAVSSIIPSTIWAILMASRGMGHCWMVDTETWYQWITDGYKLGILVINTLLLFDIIRVFVLKIAQRANLDQIKSSIKVILFLTLLFGVPLLILSQRGIVDIEKCSSADVYFFVMYTIEASQGVIIALLFCYLNKEVQRQLYQAWKIVRLRLCGYRDYTSKRSSSKTVLTDDKLSSSFSTNQSVNVHKK